MTGTQQFSLSDLLSPEQMSGPTIETEDGGNTIRKLERKFNLRLQMNVRVREPRNQVLTASLDSRAPVDTLTLQAGPILAIREPPQ